MGKCKAAGCNNLPSKPGGVYCGMSCRTRTTNLLYKDYAKTAKTLSITRQKGFIAGNCANCGVLIGFKQKRNMFCSHSCRATYTNRTRRGEKRVFSAIGLDNIRQATIKRIGRQLNTKSERICPVCTRTFTKQLKYCSFNCFKSYRSRNMNMSNPVAVYRRLCQFTFSLNSYPDKFDFDLIRKYGWYSASNRGNNLGGVSRDHRLSIVDGFQLGVPPHIMSHPANCTLLLHSDNFTKNSKSSISLEELMRKIGSWE